MQRLALAVPIQPGKTDAWLRERFLDVYGIDPAGPLPPLPETVLELRFD